MLSSSRYFGLKSRYPIVSFIFTVILLLGIIVIYELFHLANLPGALTRSTLAFTLVFAVVFSAFRFGLWPAVLSAIISNFYIIYALSGPGRNIVPIQNMLNGEWVLALLFFLPAVIIGSLRDTVNNLIQRERLARQEAEDGRAQLERIIEEMPVGIVIAKAPNGEIMLSNRHLDQILGHSVPKHQSVNDYPKNTIIDAQGNPLPEKHWPLTRVIKHAETLVNEEYFYQIDQHSRLQLQVKGAPIYNKDGDLASGVIIIDDVTAEKELVQRKDDFISMISHELKTPVTSLKMYTQILIKRLSVNPHYNPIRELEKIDIQTHKIHALINNMMDLATLQLNKDLYSDDLVSMVEVIQDVVQDVIQTHPSRKIVLDNLKNTPIRGNKTRLAQVITNLINNAIKYSSEDSEIIVKSAVENNNVLISIQDFGIGISPRDRSKIFDRFFQGPQSKSRVYPGLGIGLYFSNEIIKHHQGKIWVESKKGQGSTFYISLPTTVKSPA